MTILNHKEDRINVIRSLSAPFMFLSPFYFGLQADLSSLLFVVGLFAVIGDSNYILHLHVHSPFCRNAALNKAIDLALGLASGMSASNWRIQHIYGHHRRKDAPYGEIHDWEREKYSLSGAMSFSLRSIWPTFAEPIREAFVRGVLAREKRPVDYRYAFFEQVLLIGVVGALTLVNAKLVLFYVLPLYIAAYFISRYVDYLNHYGCGRGRFDNSNNCLNKTFNWTTHNFGYHTAHHIYPNAHWTKLQKMHRRIEAEIPDRHKKEFSWSILLLPYHFYLSQRGRM